MRAFIEMMRVVRLISSIRCSERPSSPSSDSDMPETERMWSEQLLAFKAHLEAGEGE